MRVHVQLFARAKDLAQTGSVELDLPSGTTVGTLRDWLARDYPDLASLLPRCAVAVNEEFAGDELVLRTDQTVALLPPVSGG